MAKRLAILFVAVVALVISFKTYPGCQSCGVKTDILIGKTPLAVEIADTPSERARGLSGRESLKEGEGMLFVFDEPSRVGFWMKDMNFAIDIIWIDAQGRVVGVEKGVKPESYPDTLIPPEEVKYVLEVPAYFSDTASINVGDVLTIGQ